MLGIAITSNWVAPEFVTRKVWHEYFFGPGYDEDFVPLGYGYGSGSGNTALCGSERPPLIHLIPDKIYKLVRINNTKSPTNLHTHGFHIDRNGYSDDVFRQVTSGMCLKYIWAIDEVCYLCIIVFQMRLQI